MRKNRPSKEKRGRLKTRARIMRSERCGWCRRKLASGFVRIASEILCPKCARSLATLGVSERLGAWRLRAALRAQARRDKSITTSQLDQPN